VGIYYTLRGMFFLLSVLVVVLGNYQYFIYVTRRIKNNYDVKYNVILKDTTIIMND